MISTFTPALLPWHGLASSLNPSPGCRPPVGHAHCNRLTWASGTLMGFMNTNQSTPSEHGGVVSEPA